MLRGDVSAREGTKEGRKESKPFKDFRERWSGPGETGMFAPSSSPGNKARLSLFRAIKRAPARWSVEIAPFGRTRGWSGRHDGGGSLSRVRGVEPRATFRQDSVPSWKLDMGLLLSWRRWGGFQVLLVVRRGFLVTGVGSE